MKTLFVFLFSVFPFFSYDGVISFTPKEQLIVFIQDINSEVNEAFNNEMLTKIKKLAEDEKMEFIIEEIKENAPKEITHTPAIVFRNNTGVSYFNGRWNNIDKIKNFIRGTRVMHQQKKDNTRLDEMVWSIDRIQIYAPIKITELQGKIPKKFNEIAFLEIAKKGIEKGTVRFNKTKKINADLSTRSFHLAMYPYRDKKGKYSITGEIYSQHNCIDPIYTHFKNPVVDKDPEKAFKKMAAILEEQIVHQMKNPENGDGFDIVPNTIKSTPWNKFGKMEDNENEMTENDWGEFNYKKDWKVSGAFAENTPLIFFKFASPIDGYVGEIKELNGNLNLDNKFSLDKVKGNFSIPIKSVTMGDAGLDNAIHTVILDGEKHPVATFDFIETIDNSGTLKNGGKTKLKIKGEMELKGNKIPVIASGFISPLMRNGKSHLHVQVNFKIDKSEFGVKKGPDGPDGIKEKMEFYMNFLME